ncbi:putative membrane-associated kinase regulator 4 [Vitis vinifera]|uniref:Putative membrane-associated kinase regulator 4 n=1 Tax=Vitis vinifera TaxID=29760 RepID=A0A438IQ86_VITVI|nr:putative membrane-associated kinase regulator 4 [Vitis vinifera]
MAPNLPSYNYADEDYIDMEVSPSANFLCYSINSPPQSREFEFQMSSISHGREFISPADELFYKGKLLPLHLPPRLQMVQKLLHNSNAAAFEDKEEAFDEEFFTIPFMASTIKPPLIPAPHWNHASHHQSLAGSVMSSTQMRTSLNGHLT